MKAFDKGFLHIGPHKTGSSAIQAVCDRNRATLTSLGVLYPRGRWHGQLGSYLTTDKLRYVFNRHSGNTQLPLILESDAAYFAELKQQISSTGCRRLVLSYEGFIDLNLEALQSLRSILEEYCSELAVIAYCRHPLSFAPSEISQRIRMGLPPGGGGAADLPIPKFRTYFEKFVAVFGKDAVQLSAFSKEELWGADVRKDFLLKIGVDQVSFSRFDFTNVDDNESLSAEAVRLGEALAQHEAQRNRPSLFFARYNRLLSLIRGEPIILSAAQRQEITTAARPHLDYLEKEFGLRLAEPATATLSDNSDRFSDTAVASIADLLVNIDPVTQAYRWLLGRIPELEAVIHGHMRATRGDIGRLRTNIMRSPEFSRLVAAVGPTAELRDQTVTTSGKHSTSIPLRDVTVCMIVYNEEELLPHSLAALAPIFSAFIVLDMESSDRTKHIIVRILGEKAQIVDYDRDRIFKSGYADARNFCENHANTPWVLAIDADEVLISGVKNGAIVVDSVSTDMDLATIERRNLLRWDGALQTEGRPIEHPPRLHRKDGKASWTGYIHEELSAPLKSGTTSRGKSSLVFNHLAALRDTERREYRRRMYSWMLLKSYEEASIRGGTNKWWFDEFVPNRLEAIKHSAAQFGDPFKNKRQ